MAKERRVVSGRFAIFASLFVIVALLGVIYVMSTGMFGGNANQYTPPNQSAQKWELSPLVSQYDSMNVTPVVVINCKYRIVGSGVLSHGDDVEKENLGGALCTATNSSVFCNRFGKINLGLTGFPECRSGNKTLIYAFHSPSCPISSEQRNVLDALAQEFPSKIDLQYICTPMHVGDMGSCSDEFSKGQYSQ
jgi:hypothetical protein